jgi:hypothetical protein
MTMTILSKSLAAGLTALALSTALAAGSAQANMRMGGMGMGAMHSSAAKFSGHSFAQKTSLARPTTRTGKSGLDKHGPSNDGLKRDFADRGKDKSDKFRRDRDHRDHDRIDIVTFVEPPTTIDYIDRPVIGDDAKGGKTVAKAPACKWIPVKVSITNYGQASSEKERTEWKKKFDDGAVDLAKKFVKKFGSKMAKGVLKAIVEDTTITRAMDVLITYACVDDSDNVIATKVVGPIKDEYAMHWWVGGKEVDGNEHDRQAAIAKNKPTSQPTVASK